MAKAQLLVLPAARNTVMVVDDQSTGRAILEQVVRSLDDRFGLDEKAIEAVRLWRFRPAMKGGRPVATIARAPVAFRIF